MGTCNDHILCNDYVAMYCYTVELFDTMLGGEYYSDNLLMVLGLILLLWFVCFLLILQFVKIFLEKEAESSIK